MRRLLLVLLIVITIGAARSAQAAAPTMSDAFWAQDWKTADAIFSAADATSQDFFPKKLSDIDMSLYVNSLWRRGKYAEAGALLERSQAEGRSCPDEIAPYAKMLSVLAMERTGRAAEAEPIGRELWDRAPGPLRYYLAFAMARITSSLGRQAEAIEWYRRMLSYATDRRSRVRALEPMLDLTGMTPDEAAALLIDMPGNGRALTICRALPKGTSTKVEYALGYHAYVSKQYETAIGRLQAAEADPEHGEAAMYWRAYAAFRLGRYDTAFALWSRTALSGREFPQRSIARLVNLASKSHKAKVIEALGRVADARTDYPEAAGDALAALISIGDDQTAAAARKKLFGQYADTPQAAGARWDIGWKHWKAGRVKEACDEWSAGCESSALSRENRARFLYWRSRALDRLKRREEADRLRDELVVSCPAEYYTFLVDKSGGIVEAPAPASADRKNELERWGYVTYARIEAAGIAAATRDFESSMRASRLAAWEGDWASSVRAAAPMMRAADPEIAASASMLRSLYPKAFERDVESASSKTGIGVEYIWGIMRQESMYEPTVTSHAGAYGLMQLMPGTAAGEERKMKLKKDAYKDPPQNIYIGAHYFAGLMQTFKQDPHLALAGYNAGPGRPRKWSEGGIKDMAEWVEDIPFRETRGYVKAVIRNVNVYRLLYPRSKHDAK